MGHRREVVAMSESRVKTVKQMVAEARERIHSLSAEQVATEIEGGDAILVDLREDDERFLEGTIPNSLHVPRGMIELSADPTSPLHRGELDPERRIIVYCSSGSRSALAADTLQGIGVQRCRPPRGRDDDVERGQAARGGSAFWLNAPTSRLSPAPRNFPTSEKTPSMTLSE
jgi:rhodanese-related sulfurtransferase